MAMFFAAYEGNMTMMYRYHKENVNFEDADYDGRTALHLAVCGGKQMIFVVKSTNKNKQSIVHLMYAYPALCNRI